MPTEVVPARKRDEPHLIDCEIHAPVNALLLTLIQENRGDACVPWAKRGSGTGRSMQTQHSSVVDFVLVTTCVETLNLKTFKLFTE